MDQRTRKDALYEQLTRVGKAVASPKRLELLDLLAQGERSVDELASAADMTVANTSAHLKVLRGARFLDIRKAGTRVYHRLADDDVARFLISARNLARRRLPDVQEAARAYLGDDDGLQPVSRDELLRRLERGDTVVLDVRPAAEYAAGHISGARSVPLADLEANLAALPTDTEIVAYCRGPYCIYAPQAVALLQRHGLHARQLQDGFPDWRLAGLPVESAIPTR